MVTRVHGTRRVKSATKFPALRGKKQSQQNAQGRMEIQALFACLDAILFNNHV